MKRIFRKYIKEPSIQMMILASFSIVATVFILLMGVTLFNLFASSNLKARNIPL